MAEHARLHLSARPVEAPLETTWLSRRSTHPSPQPGDSQRAQPTTFRIPLSYLGTHPDMAPFRVDNEILGRGLLYAMDTPSPPFAEVKEVLIGFRVGDPAAPGLYEVQRV